MNNRFLHWVPVLALCAAIFIQSSYPSLNDRSAFPLQDKVLHVAVYALLAALFFRSCRLTWPAWRSPLQMLGVSILFATLFGASDELHQAFVATRQADFYDLLADMASSIVGAVVFMLLIFRVRGRGLSGK